jgi:hypothetical protein
MPDYFKPWRRKIGMVTLAMACVFMMGWVRSFQIFDVFDIPGGNVYNQILSCNSSLVWQSTGSHFANNFTFDWRTEHAQGFLTIAKHSELCKLRNHVDQMECRFNWMGFASFDRLQTGINAKPWKVVWFVPYWSIVIPLTLLSAWSLLSKPRLAKNKEKSLS